MKLTNALRALIRLTGAVLIGLATAEVFLRVLPDWIPPKLGNYFYSAYGSFPGAIYFDDSHFRMNFMHPNFETTAYANGYFWEHRTDRFGFRNPPGLKKRGVLLLGDSLIYGHGVDQEQTLAHYLREQAGWDAYNMGRQGDCLYQNYVLLRLHLDRFQPKRVILFIFANDFSDLFVYRTGEEIQNPPEIDRMDYAGLWARLQRPQLRYRWRDYLFYSRALRLSAGVYDLITAPPRSPTQIPQGEDFQLAAHYYRRILADLLQRTRARDIEIEVVLLDVGKGQRSESEHRIQKLLEDLQLELGLPYRSTGSRLRDCDACVLPRDGHLSPSGAQILAEFVAEG